MRLFQLTSTVFVPVRDREDGVLERPVERVPGCIVTGATDDAMNLRVPRAGAEVFASIDARIRQMTRCTHGPWDPIGPRLRATASRYTRITEKDGSEAEFGSCLPRVLGERTICRHATVVVEMDPIGVYANQYTWRLLAIELEG